MARRTKRAHRGNRNKKRGEMMNDEGRYERDVWAWRTEAWRKERRGGYKSKKRNPPISASDLKVLRRILAVHERDNRSRRGKGKKRDDDIWDPRMVTIANQCANAFSKGKKRRNPTRAQKQARAYANAHKIGLRGRSSLKRSRRATKWALKAHRMNDGRRGRGRRWNPRRETRKRWDSGVKYVMARSGHAAVYDIDRKRPMKYFKGKSASKAARAWARDRS